MPFNTTLTPRRPRRLDTRYSLTAVQITFHHGLDGAGQVEHVCIAWHRKCRPTGIGASSSGVSDKLPSAPSINTKIVPASGRVCPWTPAPPAAPTLLSAPWERPRGCLESGKVRKAKTDFGARCRQHVRPLCTGPFVPPSSASKTANSPSNTCSKQVHACTQWADEEVVKRGVRVVVVVQTHDAQTAVDVHGRAPCGDPRVE